MTEQVPREAKLVSLLLCSSGISECEPKVIQQLLEFMYRMEILFVQLITWLGYTTDVLQDSLIYSEHAGKNELDLEDLRLGIKSQLKHMFAQPPSRDFLLELGARKNAVPLPIFEDKVGLRLPPDQQTLLSASYRITSQRRPVPSIPHGHPLAQYPTPETAEARTMMASDESLKLGSLSSAQKRKYEK